MRPTKALGLRLTSATVGITYLFPTAACAQPETEEKSKPAITLEAVYTADLWQNTRGGLRRDNVYLDNLDLVATVDAEQALGLAGTNITVSGLYNNRNTLSDTIIGDAQVICNIDTDGSLRLYEAWVEHDFGSGAIKGGLIDLNSEFDVNETGALFVSSSHGIGPDFSQIGDNGPSIFPIPGLAALAKVNVSSKFKLRAGIFEGIPGDVDRPRRTAVRLDRNEGHLLVGEAEWQPWQDARIVLGFRRLSSRDANLSDPSSGPRRAQIGGHALIEGPIAQVGEGTLRGFARIGLADPDAHDIAQFFGAGMAFSGPLLGGEQHREQLGLAIGVIRNSTRFSLEQAVVGSPVDRREAAIELTYRIQATPWLALQPDVQYIVNPGTNPTLRDALAVGLRLELS